MKTNPMTTTKKKKDRKVECPVCKGLGSILAPKDKNDSDVKKSMARILVENGFSYRQIAKMIGWKSTQSVSHSIK